MKPAHNFNYAKRNGTKCKTCTPHLQTIKLIYEPTAFRQQNSLQTESNPVIKQCMLLGNAPRPDVAISTFYDKGR